MLHRIVLVLTLLVVVSCTGDDTIIREVETQVLCSTTGEILMEGEACPPPETTTTITQPQDQQDTSDRGAPTRSDCNIQVERVDLDGTTGDDVICGNEKGNTIDGKTGDDTIYGGAGNDILIGSEERDTLKGEAGDDVLVGGADNDILDGGPDNDTVDYSKEYIDADNSEAVTVNLIEGQATDTYMDTDTLISIEIVIGTPATTDTIIGDNGSNEIDGNSADDTLLDGRGGRDTIVVARIFNLSESQDATEGEPKIRGFEDIKGRGTGDLNFTGDGGPNVITGTSGDNELNGQNGNDTLIGLRGNDELNGQNGNDTLNGGIGNDELNGGSRNGYPYRRSRK